jgi:hypothetical protein
MPLAVRDFSELIFPFFLLGSNSMGPYGENLAATSSGDDPITWGMNAWAEEACEFAILGMDGSKVFFFALGKLTPISACVLQPATTTLRTTLHLVPATSLR